MWTVCGVNIGTLVVTGHYCEPLKEVNNLKPVHMALWPAGFSSTGSAPKNVSQEDKNNSHTILKKCTYVTCCQIIHKFLQQKEGGIKYLMLVVNNKTKTV